MNKLIKKLLFLSVSALLLTSVASPKLFRSFASSEEPDAYFEQTLNDSADSLSTSNYEDETIISNSKENKTNENNSLYDASSATKIIVYGGGKVIAKPDIAFVTIGVESVNSNLQTAIKENNDIIISLIDHLKERDINDDDIKTKYYSVYQSHNYSTDEKFQEYHVCNTIEYKTYDIEGLGSTISELTSLGANRVEDIKFDCSTISECYKQALKLALDDAKSKAAGFTNKELTVDKITEECVYTCMPYRSVEAMTNSSETVKSGNIEVEAKILVVFK